MDSQISITKVCTSTVVPVMNGHTQDQAKVSIHCRWPLVTGTDGQAGDAKYNTHCNKTYYYHHKRYSRTVIIM